MADQTCASHKKPLTGAKNPFGIHESCEFPDVSFYFDSLESFFDICPDGVVEFPSYKLRLKDNTTILRASYLATCTIVTKIPVASRRNMEPIGRLAEYAVLAPCQDLHSMVPLSKEDVDEVRQIVFDAQIYEPYKHPDKVCVTGLHFNETVLQSSLECEKMLVVLPLRLQGYLHLYYDEVDHRISRGEFHYYEMPLGTW
ncbi:hypothetical protein EON64_00940 [archaeon]|nr:MAG: hypothetical protein EON64_00940 [archaeon]